MADTLLLQLVSPERMLVEEPVTEVQVPGRDGYMGILPDMRRWFPTGARRRFYLPRTAWRRCSRYTEASSKCCRTACGYWRMAPNSAKRSILEQAQHELSEATKALGSGGNGGHGGEDVDLGIALAAAMRAQAKVDAATKK